MVRDLYKLVKRIVVHQILARSDVVQKIIHVAEYS